MNMKRMRGRNKRGGGGGGGGGGGPMIRHHSGGTPLNRNHVFDSNGPDLRIRGTSQQLFEKYLQLGRDATSSGDRVMAESYFQHAEHYFRILNAMNQAAQQGQGGPQGQQNGHQQRRPNMQDGQDGGHDGPGHDGDGGGHEAGHDRGNNDRGNNDRGRDHDNRQAGEYRDAQPAGVGEQPGGESRDIPINAAPPER
jgi:hypothetical protein